MLAGWQLDTPGSVFGMKDADGDGALLASGELSASALGGLSSFERLGDRREFSANIFEELPPLCGFHFRFIAHG
jgi:hypothetical protein